MTPNPQNYSNFKTPLIEGIGKDFDRSQREFNFLTWNIGYACLGKEMDFFYEGGTLVRPEKNVCLRYLDTITTTLIENSADLILLQEVDVDSKRSWYTNQFLAISDSLKDFFGAFALNYYCKFVPAPLLHPMGRVVSGIACFLKMKPDKVDVHYFKSSFYWPKRLFFPKRCFIVLRFKLDNNKDLVVLNIHNSAYEDATVLRRNELETLSAFMKKEYAQGNYVIAGGDWNNNPHNFDPSHVISGDSVIKIEAVRDTFLVDWQFIFGSRYPTNRNLDTSYKKGITKTTVIDFFVVSPNIEAEEVETISLGFVCSDHNPVKIKIKLR